MWAFINRVMGLAWKYGVWVVNQVAGWIQRNWKAVERWLRTLAIDQIIQKILQILGL